MAVYELPPGAVCAECGAAVTGKTVEQGSVVPSDPGPTIRKVFDDQLVTNVPCGHEAAAIVSVSSM